MTVGCPVICSDIPVLRETCRDAAMYVQPDDVVNLQRLLVAVLDGSQDAQLQQMQINGLARTSTFRSAALRERWRRFFEEEP